MDMRDGCEKPTVSVEHHEDSSSSVFTNKGDAGGWERSPLISPSVDTRTVKPNRPRGVDTLPQSSSLLVFIVKPHFLGRKDCEHPPPEQADEIGRLNQHRDKGGGVGLQLFDNMHNREQPSFDRGQEQWRMPRSVFGLEFTSGQSLAPGLPEQQASEGVQ